MLSLKGITVKFAGANTPERNGIVERRFVINGERVTPVMIFAKLDGPWRTLVWAEFAKSSSRNDQQDLQHCASETT